MGLFEILRRTPAFANAEPALLARLASRATTRTLRRGEYAWRAGTQAAAVLAIRSGLVKVVRSDGRGHTAICGLFGAPDTVGDVAALKGIAYETDAVALTDTASLIMIPRESVVDAIRSSPQLGLSFACAAYAEQATLQAKIDVLSAGSVEARMATLLIKLYERFGDDFDDGSWRIPVHLSRRELADLVSTSFETAIRVMTRWEREHWVMTEPTGFVLQDPQALHACAGYVQVRGSSIDAAE